MDNLRFPGMVPLMSAFSQLVDVVFPKNELSITQLAEHLDCMNHQERLSWMKEQNLVDQMRLWDLAAGCGATLDHLVPKEFPLGMEVVHEGKNTLPVISAFEKRFVRDIDKPSIIHGSNEGVTRFAIGPGYFVAEYDETRAEVGINYYRVPPASTALPSGWPVIKTNEEGLQKYVFSSMVDYLRKLSNHVSIGRAYKANKQTPNYFILVRRE